MIPKLGVEAFMNLTGRDVNGEVRAGKASFVSVLIELAGEPDPCVNMALPALARPSPLAGEPDPCFIMSLPCWLAPRLAY